MCVCVQCLGVLYQAHLVLGRRTRCVNYQIVPLIAPFFFTHYLSDGLPGDVESETEIDRGIVAQKQFYVVINWKYILLIYELCVRLK